MPEVSHVIDRRLTRAELRRFGIPGTGPEDVLIDSQGRVLAGTDEGDILRLAADGSAIEVLANTGGRPLGLDLLTDGRVVICDGHRGILLLDPETRQIQVLLDAAGESLGVCSNPAVAKDGTIYFTECTSRHGYDEIVWDLFEGRASGRLIRIRSSGEPEVLLTNLPFPNGLAVAPNQDSVVFAESTGFRLVRYWLTGHAAGTSETFAALPGMPDNVSVGSDGLLWVALPAGNDQLYRRAQALPLWVRKALVRVAERFGAPARGSFGIMAFDFDGQVVHHFTGKVADYRSPTSVCESRGEVFLGSLLETSILAFRVDKPSSPSLLPG